MAAVLVPPADAAGKTDVRAGKYLVFHLDKEEFAIQVQKVREIMGVQDITQVPQTPSHVKGVINLRGKVIPIVDLRLKFSMEAIEYTHRTCIVVVQVAAARGSMLTGVVVDGRSWHEAAVRRCPLPCPELGDKRTRYAHVEFCRS